MRILAYGGDQFAVRNRTGEWPEDLAGVLGDPYGIPPDLPSFGLVFPGESPCLLYRERVPSSRGGYPYTLLLDLGDWRNPGSIWRRIGWNGAALASALFEPESDLLARLRVPEALTPSLIESMLEDVVEKGQLGKLSRPKRSVVADSVASVAWKELLTGSLFAQAVTPASPTSFSLTSRPSMKSVAEWIDQTPMLSRAGCGWMIGGSPSQAKVFGARIVIDDQPYSISADPRSVIEHGRRMLSLLGSMKAWEPTKRIAIERLNTPSIEMSDFDLFFRRAMLWDELMHGAELAFEKELPTEGPLVRELLIALRQNVQSQIEAQKQLGPSQSAALLRMRSHGCEPISADVVERLDPATLSSALDAEHVPPNNPQGMILTEKIRFERCLDWLNQRPRVTLDLLRIGRSFVRDHNHSSDAASQDLELRLIDACVAKIPVLIEWWSPKDPILQERLAAEASRRLDRGLNNSSTLLVDAICFCDKASVIETLPRSRANLDALLSDVLNAWKSSPGVDWIGDWLASLASTWVRDSLSVDVRSRIAVQVRAGWQDLFRVIDAFGGKAKLSAVHFPSTNPNALAEEFLGLLNERLKARRELSFDVQDFRDFVAELQSVPRFGEELLSLGKQFPSLRRYLRSPDPPRNVVESDQFQSAAVSSGDELTLTAFASLIERSVAIRNEIREMRRLVSATALNATFQTQDAPSSEAVNAFVDMLCFEPLSDSRALAEPLLPVEGKFREFLPNLWSACPCCILLFLALFRDRFAPIPSQIYGIPSTTAFAFGSFVCFCVSIFLFYQRRRFVINLSPKTYAQLNQLIGALLKARGPYVSEMIDTLVQKLRSQNEIPFDSLECALLLYIARTPAYLEIIMREDRRERKRVLRRVRAILVDRALIRIGTKPR